MSIGDKLKNVSKILCSLRSAVIAYSGGVDSSLLLDMAKDVLQDDILAVTAASILFPDEETQQAVRIAKTLSVRHRCIAMDPLADRRFTENTPQRCYWCKKAVFEQLRMVADKEGFDHVIDGATLDDGRDFRPGTQAARETGVRSPLQESGFTKHDIRTLSKKRGITVWDQPSSACLASRFPYGTVLTQKRLHQVAAAERFLKTQAGIRQIRVRHHHETARIEVLPREMLPLLEEPLRSELVRYFKTLGYSYITLDIEGFRSGSLNELLPLRTQP